MSRKLLIDTNVLLDIALNGRPSWEYAALLVDEFNYENVDGYVAATSLKDTYYILTKRSGETAAREFILAAMGLFGVVAVDETVCRMAALSNEPDFEDGIVRVCAESIPVDFIISRDEVAFKRSYLKRLSPKEYLETFCDIETIELPEL